MAVAELARQQHGVAARGQLLGLGLSAEQIKRLIRAGRLHVLHLGVYAVGHPHLSRQGRWMAAVLSGGPGAVLSHQSAAMLWQLLTPSPSLPTITTAVKGRRRPGVTHHVSRLPPDEVTTLDGIPTTTVARTLLDLAAVLDGHRLERALAEAEYRRYADSPSLPELIERHRGRRGLAALRAAFASGAPGLGVTRSALEDRFVRFLDRRRLQRPELNAAIDLDGEVIYADCLWRRVGLVAELDGRAAHRRQRSFASDRRRDRRLLAKGIRSVRITLGDLDRRGAELDADLTALGVRRR